jgi:hypothetical protein
MNNGTPPGEDEQRATLPLMSLAGAAAAAAPAETNPRAGLVAGGLPTGLVHLPCGVGGAS